MQHWMWKSVAKYRSTSLRKSTSVIQFFFFLGGGLYCAFPFWNSSSYRKENFFAKCRELEVFQRRPLAEDALWGGIEGKTKRMRVVVYSCCQLHWPQVGVLVFESKADITCVRVLPLEDCNTVFSSLVLVISMTLFGDSLNLSLLSVRWNDKLDTYGDP